MKKIVSLLSLSCICLILFSTNVFAGPLASYSFNLKPNSFNHTTKQYMSVNSGGSVQVTLTNGNSNLYIRLHNNATGNSTSYKNVAGSNSSVSFTGLTKGNYYMEIQNSSAVNISGTIAFTWDGTWGPWME